MLKTFHTAHGGKLSLARVLTGTFADGATVDGGGGEERVSGIFTLHGPAATKRGEAQAGETVGLGKLDGAKTGETLVTGKAQPRPARRRCRRPARVRRSRSRQGAQGRGEAHRGASQSSWRRTPRSASTHSQDTGEMVLCGQGEMHLRVALERLTRKYGIEASTQSRGTSPTRRRSAKRPCAAATRSSPAAMASSATSW